MILIDRKPSEILEDFTERWLKQNLINLLSYPVFLNELSDKIKAQADSCDLKIDDTFKSFDKVFELWSLSILKLSDIERVPFFENLLDFDYKFARTTQLECSEKDKERRKNAVGANKNAIYLELAAKHGKAKTGLLKTLNWLYFSNQEKSIASMVSTGSEDLVKLYSKRMGEFIFSQPPGFILSKIIDDKLFIDWMQSLKRKECTGKEFCFCWHPLARGVNAIVLIIKIYKFADLISKLESNNGELNSEILTLITQIQECDTLLALTFDVEPLDTLWARNIKEKLNKLTANTYYHEIRADGGKTKFNNKYKVYMDLVKKELQEKQFKNYAVAAAYIDQKFNLEAESCDLLEPPKYETIYRWVRKIGINKKL